MQFAELEINPAIPPWNTVIELADELPTGSWMLVGGLMTQAHAMLAGYESRATKDIDVLIDVMSSSANIPAVLRQLQFMGFELQEPGLRGSAFHRLRADDLVVDVLVADHLPKGRASTAKVNRWPMMEIAGGAQAIERKMELSLVHSGGVSKLLIPDLLGALILKAAAYCADRRDRHRHLEDVALLASFMDDHKEALSRLHGSDRKRLRAVSAALADSNDSAWLKLNQERRNAGQLTLHILSA